jgi:hypothetical protein
MSNKTPHEIEAIDDVIRAAETARELCEGTIIEQRQSDLLLHNGLR